MTLGRGAAAAIALATVLNACSAQRLGLTWEIAVITPRVPQGRDLVFRVETKDAVGALVEGVDYVWAVDWPSMKGGTHHGSSGKNQHFRLDGPKGPARLLIYSASEDGTLTERAKAEIQIQ